MKTLQGLALTALLSSSCALQSLSQTGSGSGALRMQISWPEAQHFQLLAIPPETSTLELQISGSGLNNPLSRRFGRDTKHLEISLPVGPKSLTLSAFNAQNILLASASARVSILPQQRVQAVLELQPVPAESPGPDSGSGNGNTPANPANPGSSPPPETPGDGGDLPGQTETEPTPNTPSPTPAPSPTPVPSSGGGGGGSSTSTAPQITGLSASPQILSGLGSASYLQVQATPANLTSSAFSWSCQAVDADSSEVLGSCGDSSFSNSASGSALYWQAPSAASIMPANGESRHFRLSVTVTSGGQSISQNILVTVPIGTGFISPSTPPNGGFNP